MSDPEFQEGDRVEIFVDLERPFGGPCRGRKWVKATVVHVQLHWTRGKYEFFSKTGDHCHGYFMTIGYIRPLSPLIQLAEAAE